MAQDDREAKKRKKVPKVTPERLAALVYELEPQQHQANRGSVTIDQLVDRILSDAGYPLAERAAFEVPLKRAIKAAVAERTDLEFVDGG